MSVILEVASGPEKGHKALLRNGQVLRVGRTEWSDFCFPRDATMAEVHFSLQTDGATCRLKDLSNLPAGTLVDGEKVKDNTLVADGAEIVAGGTKFRVRIESSGVKTAGMVGGGSGAGASAVEMTSGFAKVETVLASKVCERFELTPKASPLLTGELNVRSFHEELTAANLFMDNMRLLSYALPPREAVWFAIETLRLEPRATQAPNDKAAFAAAERWAIDPTDGNRRAAAKAAETARHETAAAWAAAAAGWTSGSLAPDGSPEVPPPPNLAPQAVAVAITLALAIDSPRAPQTQPACIQLGVEIAAGKRSWPKAASGK